MEWERGAGRRASRAWQGWGGENRAKSSQTGFNRHASPSHSLALLPAKSRWGSRAGCGRKQQEGTGVVGGHDRAPAGPPSRVGVKLSSVVGLLAPSLLLPLRAPSVGAQTRGVTGTHGMAWGAGSGGCQSLPAPGFRCRSRTRSGPSCPGLGAGQVLPDHSQRRGRC